MSEAELAPPIPEAERMLRSVAADDALLEFEYHPDVIGHPGTGAVIKVVCGGEEWFELNALGPLALDAVMQATDVVPVVIDKLYERSWAPHWVYSTFRACLAAMSLGVVEPERVAGVVRFVAENEDLHVLVSAPTRLGVNGVEVFMMIEERL